MLLWKKFKTISVKVNLRWSSIPCSFLCSICKCAMDSINHTFRDCISIKQIWLSSSLQLRVSEIEEKSFSDWLSKMILSGQGKKQKFQLLIRVMACQK